MEWPAVGAVRGFGSPWERVHFLQWPALAEWSRFEGQRDRGTEGQRDAIPTCPQSGTQEGYMQGAQVPAARPATDYTARVGDGERRRQLRRNVPKRRLDVKASRG